MELRDWLHRRRIKISDFASICDVCRVHMQNVSNQKTIAGKKLVRKIEEATNGEVTRYDLLINYKDGTYNH